MMKTRATYVSLEVADRFDSFIVKRNEQIQDVVKAQARDYSTLSLLKLLYQVRGGPLTFTRLYTSSKIRMKRSFLSYLKLCVEYNFIKKEAVGVNVIYSITEKGMTMLNLFMYKNV